MRCVLDTTLCDKACQWLATGRWFSAGTRVSSTNKTDSHDITEILLKVALNTIASPVSVFLTHAITSTMCSWCQIHNRYAQTILNCHVPGFYTHRRIISNHASCHRCVLTYWLWIWTYIQYINTHYIHSVLAQGFVSGRACCVNHCHY